MNLTTKIRKMKTRWKNKIQGILAISELDLAIRKNVGSSDEKLEKVFARKSSIPKVNL